MKRERLSTAETLGWPMVGFGAGLVGGLWAAGWLGRVTRGRISDEVRAFRAPGRVSSVALAAAVQSALQADPTLAEHGLHAAPVTRGTVELTGWVPDRRTRAQAVRIAAQTPGLVDIINSILVHGEDDVLAPVELTLEGRSA
ncbi:MAG: BON domain-containing protein [Gemmatimonadales bacterium]